MLLTLDDPRFPLCGQFIKNDMDNLLLEQHICTVQFEIQIYQIIIMVWSLSLPSSSSSSGHDSGLWSNPTNRHRLGNTSSTA